MLKALRFSGINIVAIHNHMTMESPRIISLQYWGGAVDLSNGLKAALATPKNKKSLKLDQFLNRGSSNKAVYVNFFNLLGFRLIFKTHVAKDLFNCYNFRVKSLI